MSTLYAGADYTAPRHRQDDDASSLVMVDYDSQARCNGCEGRLFIDKPCPRHDADDYTFDAPHRRDVPSDDEPGDVGVFPL